MTIKIHFKDFSKIVIDNHNPTEWKADPELESEIDQIWEAKKSKSPNIWNGPMLRFDGGYLKGDELHINTSLTDFKHHLGTRYETDDPVNKRANPIFVSAMITTIDNYILFGMRQNCDSHNDMYNIAAGCVHPILDAPDGHPYLGVALYRETFEEFGIIPDAFDRVSPFMVFGREEEPTQSFLYNIKLNISSDDVKRKIEAAIIRSESMGIAPEMTSAHFVMNTPESLRQELQEHPQSYTPMVADLLAYLAK